MPVQHYWTTNHESSEGNFSGPDHLDFFEQPARDPAERVAQLENSVRKLQWPLISSHAVQVPAGSFVVMSHNTYHRGSRKLDSVDNPAAVRREANVFPPCCPLKFVYVPVGPKVYVADVLLSHH